MGSLRSLKSSLKSEKTTSELEKESPNLEFHGLTSTGIAGESLSLYDVVYLDIRSRFYFKAKAGEDPRVGIVGLVLSSNVSPGEEITVLLNGTLQGIAPPGDLGDTLYISQQPGTLTAISPTQGSVLPVGIKLASNILALFPF
jgi:hypothetical protein